MGQKKPEKKNKFSCFTVNTDIKKLDFYISAQEFLNKIHNFYQGKRHRLSQKGHFLTIFEMSGFILAKFFSVRLKGDIHGNDLFSSQDC